MAPVLLSSLSVRAAIRNAQVSAAPFYGIENYDGAYYIHRKTAEEVLKRMPTATSNNQEVITLLSTALTTSKAKQSTESSQEAFHTLMYAYKDLRDRLTTRSIPCEAPADGKSTSRVYLSYGRSWYCRVDAEFDDPELDGMPNPLTFQDDDDFPAGWLGMNGMAEFYMVWVTNAVLLLLAVACVVAKRRRVRLRAMRIAARVDSWQSDVKAAVDGLPMFIFKPGVVGGRTSAPPIEMEMHDLGPTSPRLCSSPCSSPPATGPGASATSTRSQSSSCSGNGPQQGERLSPATTDRSGLFGNAWDTLQGMVSPLGGSPLGSPSSSPKQRQEGEGEEGGHACTFSDEVSVHRALCTVHLCVSDVFLLN